jgi:two-component system CheB/CheR fusion protein
LGASAGGLQAYQEFFARLPSGTGAAYVVLQHLDPDHDSVLVDLLRRCTHVPVVTAQDGMELQPDRIHVLPPGGYLGLAGGKLTLTAASTRPGPRRPIDAFFAELAHDQSKRAIAVVLSGTGNDGAEGLKAVKEHGGMVLVQDPTEAVHAAMPRQAIATGIVDSVAPSGELAGLLEQYLRHPYVSSVPIAELPDDDPQALEAILRLLLTRERYDFRAHKRSTLSRRISRRMGLYRVERITDYLRLLTADPEELHQLYRDLLIGVTSFFRDAEAFEVLEREVIAPLFRHAEPDRKLRVWVAGCATGEEAYSVAMLLLGQASRAARPHAISVLATDVDEEALETARAGLYPASAVQDIPAARLERFFQREGTSYRVTKEVRDLIVFAHHNLTVDPPFSRLDLVVCRNLLIYFEPEAQKRLLSTFHFALHPGGYLMLGGAEACGSQRHLFRPISHKWRIFQRVAASTHVRTPVPWYGERRSNAQSPPKPGVSAPTIRNLTQEALIAQYAPPAAVVDENFDVLYLHGDTSPFLTLPSGEPTRELTTLARKGLRHKLRKALVRARREGVAVDVSDARVMQGNRRTVLRVRPLTSSAEASTFVVTFESPSAEPETCTEREEQADATSLVRELEWELDSARQELQTTVDELESSNEELAASNAEALSVNEELQSANEELETSKEELQSLNEELTTVNAELEEKVRELEAAHTDLANLFSSTGVATLFLDQNLAVKRFTPKMAELMNLIETDVGRPIQHITGQLEQGDLVADAMEVLRSGEPQMSEARTQSGRWYSRAILPYRTLDDRTEGVTITFADIQAYKDAEAVLRSSHDALEHRVAERTAELEKEVRLRSDAEAKLRAEKRTLQAVLEAAKDAIVTFRSDGAIESCNSAVRTLFGYDPEELRGHDVRELLRVPILQPTDDGRSFTRAVSERVETQGQRQDGSQFPVEFSLGTDTDDGVTRFTAIIADASTRKRLEEQYQQAQKMEAIGRLSSGLAHDFNNLLMGIIGCTERLCVKLEDDHPARPYADELKRAAWNGSQIPRQLLTLARRKRSELRPVVLDEVVADIETLLSRALGEGRHLHVDLGSQGARILGDAGQLEQAIVNLVLNARDALPLGGGVTVATSAVELDASEAAGHGAAPGPYVRLEVIDNGTGMSEETRQRAFDPFYTTKNVDEGTGLGLAMVYGVVEQCEGHIDIHSELDSGTSVEILFPVTEREVEDVEDAWFQAPGGTEGVFVVEDEPLVRMAVRGYLDDAGYRVTEAWDGEQAWQLWKKQNGSVDLLVTDVALPKLGGEELANRVWQDRPELPVVFVSAHAISELVDRGRLPAGRFALQKPFSRTELLRTVRQALDTNGPDGEGDAAVPETPPDRGLQIVVVEDDPVAREVIRETLQDEGYEVREATSRREAVAACEGGVNLLLTDVRLPDGTGCEVAEAVRERKPDIAIALMSGLDADDGDVRRLLGKPRVAYLRKPFQLDELVRQVRQLLQTG